MTSTTTPFTPKRRASPTSTSGSFYVPAELAGSQLIRALTSVSSELTTTVPSVIQRQNSRSLVRKLRILHSLFDHLRQNPPLSFSPTSTLCFKELYILLHRSKALLEYCRQSSRLWVLLLNQKISSCFHGITKDIRMLLDMLPTRELMLSPDVEEHLELLQKQTRNSKLHIDKEDERFRLRIHSFLDQLAHNRVPDKAELEEAYITRLAIRDARSCQEEMEFLNEMICREQEEVDVSVVEGVIALTRFCRFLLFGHQRDDDPAKNRTSSYDQSMVNLPKDLCCTISLDLMRDPVVISSGQTYDRESITKWLEEGHRTCPNSGQVLTGDYLIPNHSLRSLIALWCSSNGIPNFKEENFKENTTVARCGSAVLCANRATVELLVRQLASENDDDKAMAARELRLLTRIGRDNRLFAVEAGALPLLRQLLSSSDAPTQENAITAILNLSIQEGNKRLVMEEEGCLGSIVGVLWHGLTEEARENSAATLVSLSVVHEHKKVIASERGALSGLSELLCNGTARGKKDAVMGLYNVATDVDCCLGMVRSGALGALVEALKEESVAEEAAGAVALLARSKVAAERVAFDKGAMTVLMEVMRSGKVKVRENAVAVMVEMCRSGGDGVAEVVAALPSLGAALRSLMVTGTKRARRKAATLDSILRRYKEGEGLHAPNARWGLAQGSGQTRVRATYVPVV